MNEKLKKRTARLLTPDLYCAVDEPLQAAIDARILGGNLQQHRERLVVVIAEAWATEVMADGQRAAAEAFKLRQGNARKAATALRALVDSLTDEAEALAALLEATDTEDADTVAIIKERRHQAAILAKSAKEAHRIASEPDQVPTHGNRTNWLLRGYFAAFSNWWEEHQKPTNLDPIKARDAIAEALAVDLGIVPDGYPIGAFARYGFKKNRR